MEVGILLWIVSACICASWMSLQASSKGMPEFRWYVAALLGNILVLPVFLYVASRAAHETSASSADQHFDTLPVDELSGHDGMGACNAAAMSMVKTAA